MALYKHGVATEEQPTSVATPAASASGLQVIIGTAPVNMTADPAAGVNTPKLCYSFAEAQAAVGYNTDFADYTLCESIYASFQVASAAPIVLINVLDPAKHKKTVSKEFLLTRPMRGVTGPQKIGCSPRGDFYSHAPCGA